MPKRKRKEKLFAVVTGDIVHSRALDAQSRKALRKALSEGIPEELQQAFPPQTIKLGVDVFRGDSWQILITSPQLSLRVCLFFRAMLKAVMGAHETDTRMSIGLGPVEVIPIRRVSDGDGAAFQRSGKALDEISAFRRIALATPPEWGRDELDVVVHLVDALSQNWTDRQGIAVLGALQGWPHEAIRKMKMWKRGRKKPLSQQAISKHLKMANWEAVHHGIEFYENLVAERL